MFTVQVTCLERGSYPEIIVDDSEVTCCAKVVEELTNLKVKESMVLLFRFSPNAKPAIVGLAIGYFFGKFDALAVWDPVWDGYALVWVGEGKNCSGLFRRGVLLE